MRACVCVCVRARARVCVCVFKLFVLVRVSECECMRVHASACVCSSQSIIFWVFSLPMHVDNDLGVRGGREGVRRERRVNNESEMCTCVFVCVCMSACWLDCGELYTRHSRLGCWRPSSHRSYVSTYMCIIIQK